MGLCGEKRVGDMASKVRAHCVDKKAVDKKRGKDAKAASASSGAQPEDGDRQPDVSMGEILISDDDAASERSDSSADDVDPSIARQGVRGAVGEAGVADDQGRGKTADRFEEERRSTTAQLQALEGRLMAEIKAFRSEAARSSTSTTAGSSRDSAWVPRKVTIKGWVVNWEDRFSTGLSPEEMDKWLELFKADDGIRDVGVVDYASLHVQNSRVLTTQFIVLLKEGSTQREAFVLKKAIGVWLQGTSEAQVQGHTLRCVTEAPPSMEARRRAGGRAYGVGGLLRRAQGARAELKDAQVFVQWGTPLEVYVRGVSGRGRACCVVTWQAGEWTAREAVVVNTFGEEVR